MTDFEYGNRSISSLVEELNNLGNQSVLIQEAKLIAIQNELNKQIRRFQTKNIPQRQFFKFSTTDKKYFYSSVHQSLDSSILKECLNNWQNGYNSTILVQSNKENFGQLIKAIEPWVKQCLIFSVVLNNRNSLIDLFGQKSMTHRELIENKKYYEIAEKNRAKQMANCIEFIDNMQDGSFDSKLIDIIYKNSQSCAELHLIGFPSQMFSSQCNPPFSLIKTQLTQILNYIKMNPKKRYEHLSKLITKRLPITNYLTKSLMTDSFNLLINFIQTQNIKNADSVSKFQFFDKLSIIQNLRCKTSRQTVQIGIKKVFPVNQQTVQNPTPLTMTRAKKSNCDKLSTIKDEFISPIERLNTKTQMDQQIQTRDNQKKLQQKQFEFCRSLQRKTHKFSISPRLEESKSDSNKKNCQSQIDLCNDKQTISQYDHLQSQAEFNKIKLSQKFSQKQSKAQAYSDCKSMHQEKIVLLKAQHARQISQYHQTIQLLNKKIMILTKEINLQQLYKIHERQIMLLELKIKQLREDVISLTKDQTNEKTMKFIVKRLNEEIKSYETASAAKKLTQGKNFILENTIKELKQKLTSSQKARGLLILEVQTLTKRLKIRDSQIKKINEEEISNYRCEQLSTTQEQILEDVKKLINGVKNQERNSAQFLLKKISVILSDLSKSRDIILECNDFLVQLMETLENKLEKRTPQIVLDCNRFIRGFLMENLSIF